MKNFSAISLLTITLLSVSAQAQTRTTALNCSGTYINGNRVEATIEKKVVYGDAGSVTLSFSLEVQGEVLGDSGKLAGGVSHEVSPNEVSPIRQEFSFDDKKGNASSITTISRLTDDSELPGSAVSIQVKTQNAALKFLKLKGILGSFKPGDQKQMNANLYISNGKETQLVGNVDLDCRYSLKE